MSTVGNTASTQSVPDILSQVRRKGVRLWSENGQLRYKAPKGALTLEEIEALRTSKDQIASLLRRHRAPLTYAQLAHWHLYQLGERRVLRGVAGVTRLSGRLDLPSLHKSLAEILRRHDALRTRIVVDEGQPAQEALELIDCELGIDDVTALSGAAQEAEAIRLIEQFILQPIDVTADPLFAARLVKLRDDEHLLVLAMEHIISDGFSRNILLRDLLVGYMQASRGLPISLPPIALQLADFALWQKSTEDAWRAKHGAYWNERLAGSSRLRFPEDQDAGGAGWGSVRLSIGKALKAELTEWCRLKRTTLVMSVLSAYVALVLRWCDVSEAVIQYEIDGRVSPKIENTIGYFASALYLRVEQFPNDTLSDLLKRVTAEYCSAYEHADFSYLESQLPRPEFTRNCMFNWVPQSVAADLPDLEGSGDALTYSPVNVENHRILRSFERDTEPMTGFVETNEEILIYVQFPQHRFVARSMERFGRHLLIFVNALLRQPHTRVKDIVLS